VPLREGIRYQLGFIFPPPTFYWVCWSKMESCKNSKKKSQKFRLLKWSKLHWLCLSKYVALLFNMIRIICTPQKCSRFNQMEEAKVSFGDVWLDTPCRIHCWCQQKADPVKGLKMSRMRSAKVLTLSESSRTSWMTQKEA
jgi:hypothetical protein